MVFLILIEQTNMMKSHLNNKLSLLATVVILFAMFSCTVADQFDTYSIDGKTYITKLKVLNGSPDEEAGGTRTFFDTSSDNYGIVYWEDNEHTNHGVEADEKVYGPDHLYFFDKSKGGYEYATCISEFFCSRQFTQNEDDKNRDFAAYKWGVFSLLKNSTPLKVGNEYYGYYFPSLEDHSPNTHFSCYLHDQTGQGDSVLRKYLRTCDVLELENSHDQNGNILTVKDPMTDIYCDHLFALVEVDIHRNPSAVTTWSKTGSISRRGSNENDKESRLNKLGDGYYDGNPSNWAFCQVELEGIYQEMKLGEDYPSDPLDYEIREETDLFLKSFTFDGVGKWSEYDKINFVRCSRGDKNIDDLSLIKNPEKTLKYYLLVRSTHPIQKLNVCVFTSRLNADGTVSSQNEVYKRVLSFTFDGGSFSFTPGRYYKISLDVGFPEDKVINEKGQYKDTDWQMPEYHLLAPAADMDLAGWGIKMKNGVYQISESNN